MPKLIDLLDQYLFSDAPGLQARAALRRAWELTTGSSWQDLYLASLDDALTEELPHLSAYSGRNTQRPTGVELVSVLNADLGDAANTLQFLEQGSRAFLTELARAMQGQRLITINRHNLFTDEYRQILLNLFDHAHIRFKSLLTRSEPEFSAALASAAAYDTILLQSIETFLQRQFGVSLTSLASHQTNPSSETFTPAENVTETFSVQPPAETSDALAEPEPTEIFPVIPPAAISETPSAEMESQSDEPVAQASPEAAEITATEIISDPLTPNLENEPAPETPAPTFPTDSIPEMDSTFTAPEIQEAVPANETNVPPAPPTAPLVTSGEAQPLRAAPNRLRVLLATPPDVQTERRLLTELVRELDTRSRARFGLELTLVTPSAGDEIAQASGQSAVELADIFIGVVWLQFGKSAYEADANGTQFFAGTQTDFALALQQGSVRDEGWLRTVIYRSIRPPLDLLHLDVSEYARVQQFFERAGAYAGDDLIRVYADASELINDARARLDAWIYNYAGDLANALSEYGKNSAASGQPAAALDDFDQAIALYRELDRPEQELALWLAVGALRQQLRRPDAGEAYETALRLARRVENDQAAVQALRALGGISAASGEWSRALEHYQDARTYLQTTDLAYPELVGEQITAHQALGDAAHAHGDYAAASDAYNQALSLAQAINDTPRIAALWNTLGALAAHQNHWADAVTAYDNALSFWNSPRDHELRRAAFDAQANAYAQIAEHARTQNDDAAAEHAYQSALRANAQGSAARAPRIEWFRALGLLAHARKDAAREIEAYDQALALLDSPQDADARRELLAQQALAYQALGAARVHAQEWDAAVSAYRDALALYQELAARSEQGAALERLGSIALARGEWQEANAYLTQALLRLDAPETSGLRANALRAQATALSHIGDAQRAAQEWAQAEIAYVQARGNLEQLAQSDDTGGLLYRLGLVMLAQSRLPEALAYFQQARARLDSETHDDLRHQSLRAEVDALGRFAEMYRGAGDFQSAHAQYRQQLELAQELQDDTLEANAFHSLGLVAADQNEWDNAVDLYDQALARAAQNETRNLIQHHQLAAYDKIGERERAARRLPQAELAYRSALTLAETLGEREQEADLLYTLGLLAIENENWDEALLNLRRALGIYNLMPVAPLKPQAIWNIGRAQRGQKRAQLNTALASAQAAREGGARLNAKTDLETALQLARDLADTRTEGIILAELGDIASAEQNWDAAVEAYSTASPKLENEPERRTKLLRTHLDALLRRSIAKREARQWSAADADMFVALDLARELNDAGAQGELIYQRGLVAAGQARWNEAIDLYSDALNRVDASSPRRADVERAQAEAYRALGKAEHDAQNWEGAESAYTQALALQRGLRDSQAQATLLAALGDVATRQARWSDAVECLTQARELAAADSLQTLDADIDLATRALKREQQAEAERQGDAKRASRDFETARAEYARALAFADELQDQTSRAELHAKLGFVATERGEFHNAVEHYRVAAGLYDAPENVQQRAALIALQAEALRELGNQAGAAGAWQAALEKYSQAIALLDAPAQADSRNAIVQLQAVTLENLGDEARANENRSAALDFYRRAAGLFALTNALDNQRVVWRREAEILADLARDAHAAQDFDLAQKQYAHAVERASEAQALDQLRELRAAQMRVLRDTADVAADAQNFNTARRSYRQALAIADELDERSAQAELYLRLGQLAARQNDLQSALLSFQYALERADSAPTLRETILREQLIAYQQLGTIQRIAGDLAAAESSYARAYANAETLDDAAHASELAFLLGMLSADQNAWESALGYYQRALDAMDASAPQRADVKSYQAYAFQQLGDAQRASGQYDAAASSYASAQNAANEIGDTARRGQLVYRLGLLQAAHGNWEQALAEYQRAEPALADAQEESLAELQRDAAFATRAFQRQQLDAQLERAQNAQQAGQWDDAVTSYRSAYALAQALGDVSAMDALRHSLVDVYAAKANTLRAQEQWAEANDAYRASLQLAREFELTQDAAQREQDLLALAAARTNAALAVDDLANATSAAQTQLEIAQEFQQPDAQADALYTLGTLATKQNDWARAKIHLEQARPFFVSAERGQALVELDAALTHTNYILARLAELQAFTEQAHVLRAEHDWTAAGATYRTALASAQELNNLSEINARRADLVALAAEKTRVIQETQNAAEIERAAQEQFAVATEFEDANAQADALVVLGTLAAQHAAHWDEAKHYFERAKSLFTPERDAERERVTVQLAHIDEVLERQARLSETLIRAIRAQDSGNEEGATADYRAALELARRLNDEASASRIRAALVSIASARTQLLAAQSPQDVALLDAAARTQFDVATEFDDVAAQANALIHLGDVAVSRNEWQQAHDNYIRARALSLTKKESADDAARAALAQEREMNMWTRLAENLVAQQEWARARGTSTRAWLLAERLGQRETQGAISNYLGYIAAQQNDFHSALKYYERALQELNAAVSTSRGYDIRAQQASIWQQLGDGEMDAAHFADAQEAYENALELTIELEDNAQRAEVLQSLGLVRGAQNNWEAARDAHAEAFALVQNADLPEAQLNILTALANAEQRVGNLEAAREHAKRALALADSLGETDSVADIEFALGELAAMQTHWQDALAHYEAARTLHQQLQNASALQSIAARQATAYGEFGDIMYGEGQWDAAQRAYARTVELDMEIGRTDRDGALLYRLGRTAAAQENYADAVTFYDRALIALTDEDATLRDRTLAQLAFALQQEGKRAHEAHDWVTAENAFTRARKMAEASDNFDQVADLWFRLGTLYEAQARTDDALHAYRQAYTFDRSDGNALQAREISEALAQLLLTRTREKMQTPDVDIETDLADALAFAEQAENPQLLGLVLQTAGEAASARGQQAEAIEYYARAGRTFAAIEDTEHWRVTSGEQATLLRRAAAEQLEASEFSDAENLYRRAWLLQQATGDASHDGETHLGLGRALLAQERYEDALQHFDQADALLETDAPERKTLRGWYADALEASAAQAMAHAQWDDAKLKFTRAANDRDELGQRARAGINWQQLAEIATTQHALDDAIYANEQALARLDTRETPDARRSVLHQQAQILIAFGEAQQQRGELAAASETYRGALNLAQEQGDLETLAQLYEQLGSLAVAQGQWEDAQTAYEHARDVYQELNQPLAQAEVWSKLGDMHRQTAQYQNASDAFENARALYHANSAHLKEGAAIEHLGHVAGEQEQFDDALDYYQAALHLYADIRARGAKAQVYRAMERAARLAKAHEAQLAAAQGDAHLDAGEWALAEQAYRDAMTLYEEAEDPALRAQAQNQLGVALEAQMRWDEAMENYRAALAELEQLNIPEAQVSVWANLGDTERQRERWAESETAYQHALELNETLNDIARAGALYNSLGLAREARRDWDGAIDAYQNAVTLTERVGGDAQEMCTNLARARHSAKQEQEQELNRELEAARAEDDLPRIGELLNALGLLAAEEQRWQEALNYYREAVTAFEKLEAETDAADEPIWRTAQGTVLNNIGDTSLEIGAWRDADYAYTRALAVARQIGDRESEAILLSQLGVTAQAQAQLPRALDLNLQALETYRELGETTPHAALLERVGDLQLQLGQTGAAETTYQQALNAASARNERERLARLWEQLGVLAEARGAQYEAIQYYQEGLARSIELRRAEQQKILYARQGALYIRLGDPERAAHAQRAALDLAVAQDDKPLQAELHDALAQAAEARGDLQDALGEYHAALALQETVGNTAEQARLHEHIGNLYVTLEEYARADAEYRAALDLGRNASTIHHPAAWTQRAAIAARENRWSDAAEFYGNARELLNANAYPKQVIELLYRRGEAAMHAHDWNTADVAFNDGLEIANASDERALYGWGMNWLGVLAQAQRAWDEALENYQEAIEILRVTEQPLGDDATSRTPRHPSTMRDVASEAHVLNNIARLKLETDDVAEADIFGQAALTVAQALGSSQEIARSLYVRGLVALHTQELDAARRFMNQAIAANPAQWAAQLQLGNTLLASGTIPEAIQQAEAGLGQMPDWELGAQTQLTIASLYNEDTRVFKANLKRTRALLQENVQARRVSAELAWAIELVLRAMEGNAETALDQLNRAEGQSALPAALDAQRFARTALLALSKTPRRFKGKPALVTYFAPPKPRARKRQRQRGETNAASPESNSPTSADALKDTDSHSARNPSND